MDRWPLSILYPLPPRYLVCRGSISFGVRDTPATRPLDKPEDRTLGAGVVRLTTALPLK